TTPHSDSAAFTFAKAWLSAHPSFLGCWSSHGGYMPSLPALPGSAEAVRAPHGASCPAPFSKAPDPHSVPEDRDTGDTRDAAHRGRQKLYPAARQRCLNRNSASVGTLPRALSMFGKFKLAQAARYRAAVSPCFNSRVPDVRRSTACDRAEIE